MNKIRSADALLGSNLLYPSEKYESIDTTPVNKVMYSNTSEKWRELLKIYIEQVNQDKSSNDTYMLEKDKEDSIFYEFFVDYLHIAISQFDNQLVKLGEEYKILFSIADINEIRENIINNLIEELMNISIRVLIQDLHEMRENGELIGNDSAERFNFYSNHILSSKVKKKELIKEYPILSRVMLSKITIYLDSVIELLERFAKDRNQFIQTFHLDSKSKLLSIIPQLGDPHNGGKSVARLEFECGKKIIYKPRPLSVDLHFQQFLEWVNKNSSLHFKTLAVLDKETYGWQEFVKFKPCESEDELSRFYRRQGGLIAILYLFNATDFHHENIIAYGEHPVLIDLEGLIQNPDTFVSQNTSAYGIALDKLNKSVISTGMLPISYTKSNVYNHDVSGLGGEAGQSTGHMSFVLENNRTDQIKITRKAFFSEEAQNRAYTKEGGEMKRASQYLSEILEGFTDIYSLFLRKKEFLLATDGPLYSFKEDRIRIILRSTQVYSTFLEASYHPDYLKSGYSRERLINFLWSGLKDRPDFKEAIEFECYDLLNEDIPYFFSHANSTDLYHSLGKVTGEYFQRSNFEALIGKAESLSEKDMYAQTDYIKSSLAIQETNDTNVHAIKSERIYPIRQETKFNPDQFIEIADLIGNNLAKKAILGEEDDVAWVGINADHEEQFRFSPLEWSLYDGLLGIGLFYAHLYHVIKNEEYKMLADKSLRTAVKMLMEIDNKSVSAYYGYGSFVYVLGNFSFLFNDQSYLLQAKNMLKKALREVKEDTLLDYLGGSAGLIIVCIHLYEKTGDEFFLEAADYCGEHLLKNSESQKNGISWRSSQLENPISGLSHGSSGFSWAMLALSHFSKEEKYNDAYVKAMNFENLLLAKEVESHVSNWCHGFAGIGMSRIMMGKYSTDQSIGSSINVALKITSENGFGHTHSLCHGDLGNLDFLLLAAEHFKSDDIFKKTRQIGTNIASNITIDNLIYGTPSGVENLGLMLGQAGIGYGFLRLAEPEAVPSVLTLQFSK